MASTPLESHDYVGPVVVACCVAVPTPQETHAQTVLLLGVGPHLHALSIGADSSCVTSVVLRFLLPNSGHLHGLVCAPESPTSSIRYRKVAAFGPYGLVICKVEAAVSALQLQVLLATRLPDWPLDVAWLDESALLVAYGRNFLEKWRWSETTLMREARWPGPAEVSFLYSTSLQALADDRSQFLCAAGTFDGFVVLWRVIEADKVPEAQQLVGHLGAIFNIRLYFHGTAALSASDDRTVRLWALEGAGASGWNCISTCRGHGCRVWDALLAPMGPAPRPWREEGWCIVSASEDSVVRIFSLQGMVLRELQGHQTRGVRCLEVLHDFTWHHDDGTVVSPVAVSPVPVTSCGEDGAVKLWPLAETQPREGGAVEMKIWQVPEPSDWIREVVLLSHQRALVATNFGKVYRLQISPEAEAPGDAGVTSELLFYDANACITSMSVGDRGTVIWIGCADGRGLIVLVAEPLVTMAVEVFRQCRVSAAFGGDAGHGLFCDHAGRVHFYLAPLAPGDGRAHAQLLAEKQIAAPKKNEKNQRLLCGAFVEFSLPALGPCWLLGDEHGNLHLVTPKVCEVRAAHEGKVLNLLVFKSSSLEFLSAGADGAVLHHHLDLAADGRSAWTQLAIHRPGCGLKHLSHLCLRGMEDTGHADVMTHVLIGAFQSADFVLWDCSGGLEVWRRRCGGAKRPNALVDSGGAFTFAFSAGSKALEIHSNASTLTATTSGERGPKALRKALHGREIHQLCWLREPRPGSNGFFATASEDTSLRLVRVEGLSAGDFSLVPEATVRFPGAVRALCSFQLDDVDGATSLLFSGGAKGALMAHLLSSTETLRCIWSTSLGSVDPIKMEDEESSSEEGPHGEAGEAEVARTTTPRLEERVMALSCTKLEKESDLGAVLLAVASSSGFLRTWRVQMKSCEKAETTLLQRLRVANTTALCMEGYKAAQFDGLFVGSADGKVTLVTKITSEASVAWQLQLHQAGVNDLTLQFFDNLTRVATLTAGDDHCIGLCHFALEDDSVRLLGSRVLEAHFSAVRAVSWAQPTMAFSLGLDRRLRLWTVTLEQETPETPELRMTAERYASCTEPETMAAINVQHTCLVALAGRGVELCSVHCDSPIETTSFA